MDNPWANAWEEPEKPVLEHGIGSWPTSVTRSPVFNDDHETDIVSPSWGADPGGEWSEPTSLWSNNSPHHSPQLAVWGRSAFEHIPIGKSISSDQRDASRESTPEPVGLHAPSPPPLSEPHSPDSPPSPVERSAELPLDSPVRDDDFRATSPPSSPDAFGTFETAALDKIENDPWTPSLSAVPAGSDEWGGGWGSPSSVTNKNLEAHVEREDEWETAKKQKEKQDRQVPPELLSSILSRFEELSVSLWPEPKSEVISHDRPEANIHDWRSGIENVEGLMDIANRLIPHGLTLPPSIPFHKTFTSKSTNEALRLTRHVPSIRISPLAQYIASKGSTAWETSVKNRPEVIQEDFLPPGWKVVEKKKETEGSGVVNDGKKKAGGGLLSFLGRRATTPPVDSKPSPRSSSPVPGSSKFIFGATAASSRTSVDTTTSVPAVPSSVTDSLPPPTSPLATLPLPQPEIPSPSSVSNISPSMAFSTATQSALPPPPPPPPTQSIQPDISREPTPPPSAVSRFLNRFSRTKVGPSTGLRSQRNSIALSSDDLEFLSDIVPSAGDDPDDGDNNAQLRALSGMIQSVPPSTKLPPPLAPPPRPPPLTKTPFRASGVGRTDSIPTADDFSSFFDSPAPIPAIKPSTLTVPSLVPPVFTPPPTLTLTPTTIHPLSSRPSTPSTPESKRSTVSSSPPLNNASSSSPTPFSFPLPPSRSHTPASVPSKRPTITAKMSTASYRAPSASSFIIPPPPSSSSSRSPTPGHPPSSSRVSVTTGSTFGDPLSHELPPAPPKTSILKPSSSLFIDEDFSDFHSQVPAAQDSSAFYDTSFSSTSSSQDLFSSSFSLPSAESNSFHNGTSSSGFDDFDDFVSSPLRTPSPPRPPSKPSRLNNLPHVMTPVPQGRASRTADHQRTQSLVESAAAKPGMWPAPPSPLPPALPPPGSIESDSFDDFLNGKSVMQQQQSKAIAGMTPSVSAPISMSPRAGFNGDPRKSSFTPPNRPTPLSTSPPTRVVSPKEKKRTLSLLETAAARPGVWPAPRSPLPQALAPPPSGSSSSQPVVDLLGGDMQLQQEAGLKALSSPTENNGHFKTSQWSTHPVSPSLPPVQGLLSPSAIPQPHRPTGFGDFPALSVAGNTTVSGKSAGGLSAQDLSFFEGL